MKTNNNFLVSSLSLVATLSALGQPIITTPPFNQAVEVGANVTLRVTASGTAPLTYQWRQDAVDRPAANNSTLVLASAQTTNAGNYTVLVTDAGGSVTSRVATLTVHVPTMLLVITNQWKFNQSGTNLGTGWNDLNYDDSAWPEGPALFYNETASLPAPKRTLLALTNVLGQPIRTYYFRAHFSFSGDTGQFLVTTNYVDDGAVFYLNGVELGRLRMSDGIVASDTGAGVAPEARADVMFFPTHALAQGDNVLAVEVHQHSLVNPDVVFGLSLKATTLAPLLPDLVIPQPPRPHIELQTFAANACEVLEGCGIAGTRRLLRFDIEARNAGTGDLVLGNPTTNPQFAFDACHDHYHFDHFAGFRMLDLNGAVVSLGRKIGFGLADVDRWDTTNGPPNPRFNGSDSQGIQRGWSDIYSFQVPCQYVDITDVPAGSYVLELEIDPENKLAELNETNNVTRLTVEIPPDWAPCNTPPPNDNFANAQLVPPGVRTVIGTTECATTETGEPVIQDAYSNRGVHSIWFRWAAPTNGSVALDTVGSACPTVLGLYRGTAVNSLTVLGADADFRGPARASRVMAAVTAGETYSICVDAYFDARGFVNRDTFGEVALNIHFNANDQFASARVLTETAGTVTGTTVGMTKEIGEPNHAGNAGARSIWHVWTAPFTGSMVFDTFGSTRNNPFGGNANTFDTLLGVYTGSSLDSLVPVASNDDATLGLVSQLSFNAVAGTTYYIAVDGKNGATGFCQLNWRPRLQVASPLIAGGVVQFSLFGEPGDRCLVETSTDLISWTPWQHLTNTAGSLLISDSLGNGPKFYRTRLE